MNFDNCKDDFNLFMITPLNSSEKSLIYSISVYLILSQYFQKLFHKTLLFRDIAPATSVAETRTVIYERWNIDVPYFARMIVPVL